MCYPKHDLLIEELLFSGRLGVDPFGVNSQGLRGVVFIWNRRTGEYQEVTEQVEQAGKRPKAPEYRRFTLRHEGRMISIRTNRLMGVAIHGPSPLEFDHWNDDSLDCWGDNVQPLSQFENEAKKREMKHLEERGVIVRPSAPCAPVPF